jgi:hypothetical protein
MEGARETLEAHAVRAGYGAVTVSEIARLVLGHERASYELTERQAALVDDAIDTLTQAGMRDFEVAPALRRYRERYGQAEYAWHFWRRTVRLASRRYNDAPHYGLSPLESDPVRLARWGPAPDWSKAPPAMPS